MKAVDGLGPTPTLALILMPDYPHWPMSLRTGGIFEVMRLPGGRRAAGSGSPASATARCARTKSVESWPINRVAKPPRAGRVEHIGGHPWWGRVWLDGAHSRALGWYSQ
jgi:hypothetical protein